MNNRDSEVCKIANLPFPPPLRTLRIRAQVLSATTKEYRKREHNVTGDTLCLHYPSWYPSSWSYVPNKYGYSANLFRNIRSYYGDGRHSVASKFHLLVKINGSGHRPEWRSALPLVGFPATGYAGVKDLKAKKRRRKCCASRTVPPTFRLSAQSSSSISFSYVFIHLFAYIFHLVTPKYNSICTTHQK